MTSLYWTWLDLNNTVLILEESRLAGFTLKLLQDQCLFIIFQRLTGGFFRFFKTMIFKGSSMLCAQQKQDTMFAASKQVDTFLHSSLNGTPNQLIEAYSTIFINLLTPYLVLFWAILQSSLGGLLDLDDLLGSFSAKFQLSHTFTSPCSLKHIISALGYKGPKNEFRVLQPAAAADSTYKAC